MSRSQTPHVTVPDAAPEPDEHDPEWSRARYDAVLGRIESNTGGRNQPNDLPPGIDRPHIHLHLSQGSYGRFALDRLNSALQAAIENGDVFSYRGIDGKMRYALRTEEGLRAVLLEEAARDHPRRELVGWLNRELDSLDDNADADRGHTGGEI